MKPSVRLTLAMALLAGLGAAAHADPAPDAGNPRVDRILKTLGAAHRFGTVAVAPDGRSLAWTLREGKASHVQLADIDGRHVREVHIDGADGHCGADDLHWSPDGRRLAFLSDCGSKREGQQNVFLAKIGTGALEARRLSHLDGYAHDLSWAPDGRSLGILYVAGDTHRVGATAATKRRTGVIGVAGIQHQRVAAVDAGNGSVRELSPADLFVYEYDWAPDSARLAYVAAPPPGANNWWVAKLYAQPLGAAPNVVLDPASLEGPSKGMQIALPRWSPDGRRIAVIGGLMSDQGVTGGDIHVVAADGSGQSDITRGLDYTPSWLAWTGDDRLLVSAFAEGGTRIAAFRLHGDTAAPATLYDVPAAISDGGAMSSLAMDAAHRTLAFIHSDFGHAPEIYTASLRANADGGLRAGVAPHAVTAVNAGLKPLWGKAESVTWHNQGFRVQGWLLYPADYDPHKTYPLIVSVHGGPAYAVRPSWPGVGYGGAPLSAMGYFVLFPNPRGSFGQGEAFTRANRRDFGYGDLRDILAGVDAVEKSHPVDDARLGLTGWSYGGFMSMFAPTQTQRFKAVVAGAGLSNWQSYYGENSIDQWMIPFFGASVYDDPQVYAKSSAINFVKQAKAPTLLLVGELDGETPAPQSFEYWHALRAMGVPTRLVVYPGEGHGFASPAHRRDVLVRALDWFDTYLGKPPH